jgi:hypothetical protein
MCGDVMVDEPHDINSCICVQFLLRKRNCEARPRSHRELAITIPNFEGPSEGSMQQIVSQTGAGNMVETDIDEQEDLR